MAEVSAVVDNAKERRVLMVSCPSDMQDDFHTRLGGYDFTPQAVSSIEQAIPALVDQTVASFVVYAGLDRDSVRALRTAVDALEETPPPFLYIGDEANLATFERGALREIDALMPLRQMDDAISWIVKRRKRISLAARTVRRDRLTGLPNENEFLNIATEMLQIMSEEEIDASVALLALESYPVALEELPAKLQGDLVGRVASTLSMTFRGTDTIAHTGNGVFAALFPSETPDGAIRGVRRALPDIGSICLRTDDGIRIKARLHAGIAPLTLEGGIQVAGEAAAASLSLAQSRGDDDTDTTYIQGNGGIGAGDLQSADAARIEPVSLLVADSNVGRQLVAGSVLHRHGYYDLLLAPSLEVTRRRLSADHPQAMIVALDHAGFGAECLDQLSDLDMTDRRLIVAAHDRFRQDALALVAAGRAVGVIRLPYDALTLARDVSVLLGLPETSGPRRDKTGLDREIRALAGH